MLCDNGIAVTQLIEYNGVIGTVLFNGEQSCHALAPIAPEYAHFLSDFPKLMKEKGLNEQQRREKFETAKTEIRKYFESEISHGIVRRLSLDELMAPLNDFETLDVDDPKQEIYAYSVLPRTSFFDSSELFFIKLREELTPLFIKLREKLTKSTA